MYCFRNDMFHLFLYNLTHFLIFPRSIIKNNPNVAEKPINLSTYSFWTWTIQKIII